MPDPRTLLDELYALAMPSRETYFMAIGAPESVKRELARRFAHATLDVARRHGLDVLKAALHDSSPKPLQRDRAPA